LPTVSNPQDILYVLYFIKKQNGQIYYCLDKTELTTLFKILSQVSYSNIANQKYITQLPIFTTIQGNLISLASVSESKVWIWKDKEVCQDRMDQWINTITGHVFLDPDAPWGCIKHEAENLNISWINRYCVYYDILFPYFHLFDLSLQIHHLEFIKRRIYPNCLVVIDDNCKVEKFVEEFKVLRFLPDNFGGLQTISSFYDGCCSIFELFCDGPFLPHYFREEEWYEFFEFFGLKTSPTVDEFMSYCKKLPEFCDVTKIAHASSALLTALLVLPLQGDNKHKNLLSSDCLREISQIPIAVVESFSDLNCIAAQEMGGHQIECCNGTISLAKLADASVVDNKHLLWTTKPLIKLPSVPDGYKLNTDVLEYCGVVQSQPSEEDVIMNLLHLSSTFAPESFKLSIIETYDSSLLVEVVVAILEFLQQETQKKKIILKHASKELRFKELINANFVPVKRSGSHERCLLAKPMQVLHMDSSHVAPFYPYLHCLIDEAHGVTEFLSGFGVEKSINFSHIQFVLKSVTSTSNGEKVDGTVRKVVIEATDALIKLLQHKDDDECVACSLRPLYLLSLDSKLVESSKLIVNDITGKLEFSLPFGYAFLNPLKGEKKIAIKQLVDLLPKQLGLKSLKSMMEYEIANDITEASKDVFPHVFNIEKILRSNEFKVGIEFLACCYTDGVAPPSVTRILESFQNNLSVRYLNNLQVTAKITIDDEIIPVDHLCDDWFLLQQTVNDKWELVLKNTPDNYPHHIFSKLTSQLCSKLGLKSDACFQIVESDTLDLTLFVNHMLQSPSVVEVAQFIKLQIPDIYISESSLAFDGNMQPSIGDTIPEQWHEQLAKCSANVFELEEWVGYENDDGTIVYSQILKTNEEIKDGENEAHQTYLVATGKGKPIKVKHSELHKILNSKTSNNDDERKINIPVPQRRPDEAKRWMKQAEHDYAALCVLINGTKIDEKVSATTCFMSHEVAERSLKAGLYAKGPSVWSTH